MDYTAFEPSQCHLHKRFNMPKSSGAKVAVAVSFKWESIIISSYTILVGVAFMALWLLITTAIPILVPARFRSTKAIRVIAEYEMTEPFQAACLMARFCFKVIREVARQRMERLERTSRWGRHVRWLASPGGRLTSQGQQSNPVPASTWSDFFVGLSIIVLALGMVLGGLVAGLLLPDTLVIGHVAPVNDRMVLVPSYNLSGFSETHNVKDSAGAISSDLDFQVMQLGYEMRDKAVYRALLTLDAGMITKTLEDHVRVERFNKTERGSMGEDDYHLEYGFQIYGWELGLQHLVDLSFHVSGRCEFEYDWYRGPENVSQGATPGFDLYEFFPGEEWAVEVPIYGSGTSVERYLECRTPESQENGVMFEDSSFDDYQHGLPFRFACVPNSGNGLKPAGTDPWYLTRQLGKGEVAPPLGGRPPLHCVEQVSWRYKGMHLGSRLSSMVPNPGHVYNGIVPGRRPELAGLVDLPDGIWVILATSFHQPLLTRVMRRMPWGAVAASRAANALLSSHRRETVHADLKRWVMAAYLLGRNTLRDAALAYIDADIPVEFRQYNALQDLEGKPIRGAGDFVIPCVNVATTLRIGTLVGVPAVVVGCWLLLGLAIWGKRVRHSKAPNEVDTDESQEEDPNLTQKTNDRRAWDL
ncbi:hypothetical protein BDZ91DRAFT_748449 [Kalaharituber pfeilii]|nr:hypothetical protein BDZ91DRAFT_748449 [Kalaharituber pfeilii]